MTSTNFAKSAKSAVSTLVLAIATLGAASSFAASNNTNKGSEGEMLAAATFVSTTTRADVKADYLKAAKSGQIVASTEGATLKAPEFMSTRAAADVRLEAVVAAQTPVFGTL